MPDPYSQRAQTASALDSRSRARSQISGQGNEAVTQLGQKMTDLVKQYPWLAKSPGLALAVSRWSLDKEKSGFADRFLQSVPEVPGFEKGQADPNWINGALAIVAEKELQYQTDVETARKEANKGWWDKTLDAGKGAIRGVMAGFDTAGEYAENYVSTTIGSALEMDPGALPLYPGVTVNTVRGMSDELQGNPAPAPRNMKIAGVIDTPVKFNPYATPIQNATGTVGGQAIQELLRGEKVDFGSGFFVDPDAKTPIAANEYRRKNLGQIDGHVLTPGRVLASTAFKPDSLAWDSLSGLVDLGFDIYADPASAGLGEIGDARKFAKYLSPSTAESAEEAERVIAAGGRLSTTRKGLYGRSVDEWLTLKKTQPLIEYLTGSKDFLDIYYKTGKKLSPETYIKLIDAEDPRTVRDILRSELGLLQKEALPTGLNFKIRQSLPSVPTFLPESTIDMRNGLDNAIENVDRYLRQIPSIDTPTRSKMLEQLTRAGLSDSYGTMRESVDTLNSVMVDALVAAGMDRKVASEVGRIHFSNDVKQLATDEIGNTYKVKANVGGEEVEVPYRMQSQMFHGVFQLPDARNVREAVVKNTDLYRLPFTDKTMHTKALGRFARTQMWRVNYAGKAVTQAIWMPIQLLRPQFGMKVIADDQLRMAAAGYDGVLNSSPTSTIALAVGHAKPGMNFDALGEELIDLDDIEKMDWVARRSVQTRRFLDAPEYERIGFAKIERGDTNEYFNGWANELGQTAADPLSREIARWDGTADELFEAFWDGDLASLRKELAKNPDYQDVLNDVQGARSYFDNAVEHVNNMTRSDKHLREIIANGKSVTDDGTELRLVRAQTGKKLRGKRHAELPTIEENLDNYLRTFHEADDAPEYVIGPTWSRLAEKGKKPLRNFTDNTVSRMFDIIATNPSNRLSRSPLFAQSYWERVADLVPYLDDAGRKQLRTTLDEAMQAGQTTPDVANRVRTAMDESTPQTLASGSHLNVSDLDEYSKAHALTRVEQLLFDLHAKGRHWEALRAVFPFGEAWQEAFSRWGRIASFENPRVPRRLQQFFNAARSPDLVFLPWMGMPSGEGFFYYDPQQETEMFVDPLATLAASSITGTPVTMRSRVEGLNMAASGLPGMGPVFQIPAQMIVDGMAHMVDNDTAFDPIREVLQLDRSKQGGIIEQTVPSWAKALLQAGKLDWLMNPSGEQARAYGNTVKDIAAARISQGDVDAPKTEEDIREQLDQATWRASTLYLIKSVVSLGGTGNMTTVNPRVWGEDKDGKKIALDVMINEYNQIRRTYGNDLATSLFLARHGTDNMFAVTPRTETQVFEVPTSKDGYDWVRKNEGIAGTYPEVYGFFAPETGEFSYDAYLRALGKGELEPLNGEEWMQSANRIVGMHAYNKAKDKVAAVVEGEGFDTDQKNAARQWLRDYRKFLAKEYVGFDSSQWDDQKWNRAERQLRTAKDDKRLKNTDTAKGLQIWFNAVDQANEWSRNNSPTGNPDWWRTSTDELAVKIRAWFNEVGTYISGQHADFSRVFDLVLSNAYKNDYADAADVVGGMTNG